MLYSKLFPANNFAVRIFINIFAAVFTIVTSDY